jgi:hypothetical protein
MSEVLKDLNLVIGVEDLSEAERQEIIDWLKTKDYWN